MSGKENVVSSRNPISNLSHANINSDIYDFFPQGTGNEEFDKALEIAGYAYDPIMDIFYSILDPWQRDFGYCQLYDEASAPLGMIVDCEPVRFEYGGKNWLIEFWKGQYDYVTGAEIGIYTGDFDLDIPELFTGNFYNSISNDDLLEMSFTLKKNGKPLFTRRGRHWWLTGFKLGEFSEPSELTMDINITLKDSEMCKAFLRSIRNLGYSPNKIKRRGNSISFLYGKPYSPQPITRTPVTDWIIQKKNKMFCKKIQSITKKNTGMLAKVNALKENAPGIYEKIKNMGRTKQLYEAFENFKKYMD